MSNTKLDNDSVRSIAEFVIGVVTLVVTLITTLKGKKDGI